jgi:hypothetical protein
MSLREDTKHAEKGFWFEYELYIFHTELLKKKHTAGKLLSHFMKKSGKVFRNTHFYFSAIKK